MVVLNKPAGLVCHPTKLGPESSLIGRIRLYLGEGAHPQLVNRLDRETSGIIVCAKTHPCAVGIRRLWENQLVLKQYLAIVHGYVQKNSDIIDAPIGKDLNSIVAIKECIRADGSSAQTEYRVIKRFSRNSQWFTLLQIIPRTGRKHQIRLHLAHIGHPIVGDKIYGGDETAYLNFVKGQLEESQKQRLILPFQALHASNLKFTWQNKEYNFSAEPEKWFKDFVPDYENTIIDQVG